MKLLRWFGFILAGLAAVWALSQGRRNVKAARDHEAIETEHAAIAHRVEASVGKAEEHRKKKEAAITKAVARKAQVEERVHELQKRGDTVKADELASRANALFR